VSELRQDALAKGALINEKIGMINRSSSKSLQTRLRIIAPSFLQPSYLFLQFEFKLSAAPKLSTFRKCSTNAASIKNLFTAEGIVALFVSIQVRNMPHSKALDVVRGIALTNPKNRRRRH
jgi:hypothetical protein